MGYANINIVWSQIREWYTIFYMEQLTKYIKDQQAAGFTNEQIMTACLSVGYTEEQLRPLFMSTPPPPIPTESSVSLNTFTNAPTTEETKILPPLLSIGAYISDSFTLITKRPFHLINFVIACIGAVIASAIVTSLGTFFIHGLPFGDGVSFVVEIITQFIAMIPMLFPIMALMYVYLKRDENVSYWAGLEWAFLKTDSLIIVYALLVAIPFGGLLFFIIPAIVLNIYLLFSLPFYLTSHERGMSALLRSTHLVYGQWWAIFTRMIVFALLIGVLFFVGILVSGVYFATFGGAGIVPLFVGLIIMGLGVFIVTAWGMAATVLLFESLQARQTSLFVETNYSTAKIIYTILAIIGAAAFCALIYFAK